MTDTCCAPLIPASPVPDCVVTFDYGRWITRYPVFDTTGQTPVGQALAQEYFYDATMWLDNTCASPVCDASVGGERERLLFMLTAHIATINGAGSAAGAGPPGRLTNQSVGPISAGFGGLDALPGTAAWYAQTAYGLDFYQATAKYRTFHYRRFWGYPGRGALVL